MFYKDIKKSLDHKMFFVSNKGDVYTHKVMLHNIILIFCDYQLLTDTFI